MELLIPLFARDRERFGIGVEGVIDFMEQSAHGIGADVDLELAQVRGDLAEAFTRPEFAPSHRITRRALLEESA
jgi:hypothetical protein